MNLQFEPSQNINKVNLPNLCYQKHKEAMWVHLFSDGAVERITSSVAAERVIRDPNGNSVLGYNWYLGNCTLFEMKFWGILDGLLILLNKWYKQATIQINNAGVVKALTDMEMKDSNITVILRKVQRIMCFKGQWRIKIVPRETNIIADCSAKVCLAWNSSLQMFDVPLNETLGPFNKIKLMVYLNIWFDVILFTFHQKKICWI